VLEISEKHREIFKSLASGWMRIGATCVQLVQDKEVLIGQPDTVPPFVPVLTTHIHGSDLTLNVYGNVDLHWAPSAEATLDLLAKLMTADHDLDSMTGALVETQDRLVALYELTQATRRTLDVPLLLDLLLQQSKHLLDVDGGFVVLKEKDKKSIIHQVSETPLHPAHMEAAVTLYQRDPNRNIFKDSETLPSSMRNVMMVSLPIRDEVSASVGLFNKTGNFTTPDIKLAKAIAGHIGAQLENAMLHKEAVERTRLETEMDIARQVQTAILPQTLPHVDGLDIYATSIPAFEVGGDFFDVIDRSKDSLVFALGDVTGKGMPAALLMSMSHTIIKAASRNMPFTHPHQVLDRLNHDMATDFTKVGMFTTVMLGLLDCKTGSLHISNAGQSPIYYLPVDKEPVLLEAQDIPVGILDTYKYSTQSIQLTPGDIFIAASDGFPESRNSAGDMYGYERMKALLASKRGECAKEIAESLLADVNTFCGRQPQEDDRTIVIIEFQGNSMKNLHGAETLTVPANFKDIRVACDHLRTLLARNNAAPEDINLCELALQELLTNLVEHAYEDNPSGKITVTLTYQPDQLHIATKDSGTPAIVNLSVVAMPEPHELAEGGYGLAIIQSVMDEVKHTYENGWNHWQLIKKLSQN
jgi:sigma-B regulation protein RsbU (phosphoserine phosphatase)